MSAKRSIIVHGYIRRIDNLLKKCKPNYIIPTTIIQICYQYYLCIAQFFVTTRQQIININIDHQKVEYISDLNGNCNRTSCFIPDLSLFKLPSLNNKIKNNTLYDGIFTYKAYCHSLNLLECNNDNNNCISFKSKIPGNDEMIEVISGYHISILRHEHDYIYCGDRNGIIAATEDGIYQLKLENISTDNFNFLKLNDKWTNKKYCIQRTHLSLCYMDKHDKIFAVENYKYFLTFGGDENKNEEGLRKTKCGIFEFETNEWEFIEDYKYNPYLRDDNLYCGLCYDGYNDFIYLVSSQEQLSRYDLNKNKWEYISGLNDKIGEGDKQIFDRKPIIWLDDKNTNIIYYAVYKGYEIEIKCYDQRNNVAKWMRCYQELTKSISTKITSTGHVCTFK